MAQTREHLRARSDRRGQELRRLGPGAEGLPRRLLGVLYAGAALFRDLALARADGSLRHLLARLGRIDVLVIDDWAMAPLTESERRDFWEICEDRYQTRSTDSDFATAGLAVARADRRSDAGRRHSGPAGSQRSSHRDARRFDAQEPWQTGRALKRALRGCCSC